MPLVFPECGAVNIEKINNTPEARMILDTTVGAASGYTKPLVDAEVRASLGAVAGPLGETSHAVLGPSAGGIPGCLGGAMSGSPSLISDTADGKIVDEFRCLSCSHTFSA